MEEDFQGANYTYGYPMPTQPPPTYVAAGSPYYPYAIPMTHPNMISFAPVQGMPPPGSVPGPMIQGMVPDMVSAAPERSPESQVALIPAESASSSNSRVPPDWKSHRTPDGKIFYTDPELDNKTFWPPPQDWSIRKKNQKVYYVHHPTKSTHWKLPPSGWTLSRTPDGKVLFTDPKTCTTYDKLPDDDDDHHHQDKKKELEHTHSDKPAKSKPKVIVTRGTVVTTVPARSGSPSMTSSVRVLPGGSRVITTVTATSPPRKPVKNHAPPNAMTGEVFVYNPPKPNSAPNSPQQPLNSSTDNAAPKKRIIVVRR